MKKLKFEVEKVKVKTVLDVAETFVSKAKLDTVLNYAYMEKKGEKIELTTSDGNYSFTAPMSFNKWDGEDQSFLLPLTAFTKLVNDLPVDVLTAELDEGKVKIKGKNFKYSLVTKVDVDYVFLAPGKLISKIRLASKDLAYSINKVSYATSNDPNDILYYGVLVNLVEDSVDFVATDKKGASLKTIKNEIKDNADTKLLIPKVLIGNLIPLLKDDEGQVEIEIYDNILRFVFANGYKVSIRKVETEKWAVYEKFVNLTRGDYEVITSKKILLDAIKRMDKVMTTDKIAVMDIDNSVMTIRTLMTVNEAEETIEVQNNRNLKKNIQIVIRGLIDMLNAVDTDDVVLKFDENDTAPIYVKELNGDNNWISLMMPIKK